MRHALAKRRARAELSIGMDLVVIARQPGKGDNVTFSDGAAGGDDLLANLELFKILTTVFRECAHNNGFLHIFLFFFAALLLQAIGLYNRQHNQQASFRQR